MNVHSEGKGCRSFFQTGCIWQARCASPANDNVLESWQRVGSGSKHFSCTRNQLIAQNNDLDSSPHLRQHSHLQRQELICLLAFFSPAVLILPLFSCSQQQQPMSPTWLAVEVIGIKIGTKPAVTHARSSITAVLHQRPKNVQDKQN